MKILEQRWTVWFALLLASSALVFGPDLGLGFVEQIDTSWRKIAVLGVVLFGSLTLVGFLSALWRGCGVVGSFFQKRRRKASYKRAAENSLNDLTELEWSILAYLVTRGERHFTSNINGGRAASLIGRGLIHIAARPGQSLHVLQTPFSIDDAVWEALLERKRDFVHPNPNGRAPYSDLW